MDTLYKRLDLWYSIHMDANETKTQWTPTRHGGFRRTGLAQEMGNLQESVDEARAEASVDVEDAKGSSEYLEERSPHTGEDGRSTRSPGTTKFIIKMNEHLGLDTCPYLVRWRVETPWFSVRLHHWLGPDDDRAPHDHPWSFRTFVLKGGYLDASPSGDVHLKAPATRKVQAEHQHTVYPDAGGAWTIIVTGRKTRNWGFWVKGKFKKANKYFLTYGHHPCN